MFIEVQINNFTYVEINRYNCVIHLDCQHQRTQIVQAANFYTDNWMIWSMNGKYILCSIRMNERQ